MTATDLLLQNLRKNSELYSLRRFANTPGIIGNAPLGNVGSSAGGVQAAQANYLKVQGDTMVGPIAFYPATVSINASDELDISPSQTSTPQASSRVIASFSSPDKIQLIKGAQFAGQLLFLQVPAASVLTLEDYSNNAGGNIVTSDQADFVITTSTDPKIVMLQFDVTVSPNSNNGGWVVISSMSAGGGTLTEPLLQTVTAVTPQTEPTTTDIDCSIGNVYTITVDKDITMDLTNETASKYQLVHIIFIQDGTGGHTVSWPSTVKRSPLNSSTPTVSETASDQTDVILYTTDQGTNWYWVVSSKGGALGQTPWTSDIDADGFDLKDISNIEFRVSTGTPAGTVPSIYLDASGDMVQNVDAGDQFFRTINGEVIEQVQDAEHEIRTENQNGPVIKLNNNDQTPTDNDVVGTINFTGNDDLLANVTYAAIRTNMDDVTSTSKQADFDIRVMHDNALAAIVDYTGSDATFRFSANVDVVRPNRDDGIAFGSAGQSWADAYFANFLEIKEMTTPGNPPANSGRLYVADDGGTTTLYFRDSAGTETDLLVKSPTPWTSNIDADGFDLQDLSNIEFRNTTGAPSSSTPSLYADAGGINYNAPTGDDHDFKINDVSVAHVDATNFEMEVALELNSNDLQYSGTGNKLAVTGSTHVVTANSTEIFRYNDSSFRLANQLDMQDNEIIMDEMGTAPTGASNAVKIYAEDNGAGKTRLMAIFPTGAAQQIVIEP